MNYDNLIYESGPVKFSDYISNKYNIVHLELYEDALYKYLYDFIYKLLVEKVLYSLISKFNNFITDYNDYDELINYDEVKTILDIDNGEFRIINLNEITEDMISCNNDEHNHNGSNFISQFVNSIWEDNNCKTICEAFKELDMFKNEQDLYITFVLFNLLVLLYTCKVNISKIFNLAPISDFIIKYNNSIYIIDENGESFICTEDNVNDYEAIFILENMVKEQYHIGYTTTGKWILDIDPEIDIESAEFKLNYDKIYNIMNKTNSSIIDIMIKEMINRYLDKHKIIEIKNKEYWQPSSIIIYSVEYPYTKTKIDLTPWWNTYQRYDNYQLPEIKIIDESINDNIIEEINYVKGQVNVYSKLNDLNYLADFNYIKEDTEVDDDKLSNTFYNKIKNLYL